MVRSIHTPGVTLLVALCLACAAHAAGADPVHYDIEVRVDYASASFESVLTADVTNTMGVPLEDLVFRIYPNEPAGYFAGASVAIATVSRDGQPCAYESERQDSILRVLLDEPLPPGSRTQIEIAFAGGPARTAHSDATEMGLLSKSGDGMMMLAFYPVLALHDGSEWSTTPMVAWADRPASEEASYKLAVTANSSHLPITPGQLVETVDHGDGTSTHHYFFEKGRDTLVFLPDGYERHERTVGTATVSLWLPSTLRDESARVLDAIALSLSHFESTLGLCHYESILVIVVREITHGFEFPGGFAVAEEQMVSWGEGAEGGYERLFAHQVSHLWFMNAVGSDSIVDSWLAEALATFLTLDFARYGLGDTAHAAETFGMRRAQKSYFYDTYPSLSIVSAAGDFPDRGTWVSFVYSLGSYFIEKLRLRMGDEAFRVALAAYYDGMRGLVAQPEDFLRFMIEGSEKDLTSLLESYRIPVPAADE